MKRDVERIHFEDFLNAILEYQIKEHQKYLSKFLRLYSQVCKDNSGII